MVGRHHQRLGPQRLRAWSQFQPTGASQFLTLHQHQALPLRDPARRLTTRATGRPHRLSSVGMSRRSHQAAAARRGAMLVALLVALAASLARPAAAGAAPRLARPRPTPATGSARRRRSGADRRLLDPGADARARRSTTRLGPQSTRWRSASFAAGRQTRPSPPTPSTAASSSARAARAATARGPRSTAPAGGWS